MNLQKENLKEDVKINALFEIVFTEEEIDKILWNALMCKCSSEPEPITCDNFIEQDLGWFIDKVIEGVTK